MDKVSQCIDIILKQNIVFLLIKHIRFEREVDSYIILMTKSDYVDYLRTVLQIVYNPCPSKTGKTDT